MKESKQSLEQERILVVEDEQMAKILAKSWFASYNFIVDVAEHYAQVRQLLSEHRYCIILMDIGLARSEESGLDITAKLKKDWRTAHIPIVGLTSHAGQQLHLEAIRSGMSSCYLKPLTRELSLQICREHLPEAVANFEASQAQRDRAWAAA